MFRTATMTGPAARVTWGYHVAAQLQAWSLTADGNTVRLTAAVESSDAFKLTQQGLSLCIPRQKGAVWTYPIESLHIADRTLTAVVRFADEV